ncbi:hypothetical protein CKO19_12255 [Rhodovulum adriaticum]|nr:hypothetical protein [Rhodovulum adriaticum]
MKPHGPGRIHKVQDTPDPAAPAFRQGETLGEDRTHWFRANFFQQYRLFFRFDSTAKVIVLAWGNDEQSVVPAPEVDRLRRNQDRQPLAGDNHEASRSARTSAAARSTAT